MSIKGKLLDRAKSEMTDQSFSHLAFGWINFKDNSYDFFELAESEPCQNIVFDLASLTKPLTLGALYLKEPKLFEPQDVLLLEHRGGLPSWAKLDFDQFLRLKSAKVVESATVYSDLSSLSLMLKLEDKTGKSIKELASFFWDKDICYWLDLDSTLNSPPTGFRSGETIKGAVNDDNAFILKRPCAHAGLFSSIKGLCLSLLELDKQTQFVKEMKKHLPANHRFVRGWDTKEGENSLAGKLAGKKTFGHLGFTGTSIWIDSERELCAILLTNATMNYWYARTELNRMRRSLYDLFWSLN